MALLSASETWRSAYPGAVVGTLVLRNATNPKTSEVLSARKREIESKLRAQFSSRAEIESLPVIQAYSDYYKAFRKTYHVLHQLESVALKGKSIPSINPLVTAMFIAELDNMLLTAGHDLELLEPPITLDIARGEETYTLLNGKEQTLKPKDMFVKDASGVISSIIYGPDRRTSISPQTRNLLFVVYAPSGVGEARVRDHLADIQETVRLFSPDLNAEPIEYFLSG